MMRSILKIFKHKDFLNYSLVILAFSICMFSICYMILSLNMRDFGKTNILNNYYDVVMNNATIDYETTSTIKLDNDKKIIEIKIDDLYKYKNGNSINLELYNIGNMDAIISNMKIIDVETSVNRDKVEINSSIKINDVIEAREERIMNILIKCNENIIEEEDYLNFKISINYNEIRK